MRTRRRIFQILIFLLFLFIFFKTLYPLDERFPNFFMTMSALYPIVLLILGKFTPAFILGIIILILTIFLGRFFCGWICPMGTTLDIGEKLTGASDNSKEAKNFGWLKYLILTAIIVSAIFRHSISHFFEPMALSYRFYTFTVFPLVNEAWMFILKIFPKLEGKNISHIPHVVYRGGFAFLVVFIVIILLGRYYRRFWCRNLCPVGALLSIAGRFTPAQKKVSDKCINCGKCTKKCKMGAIPDDPKGFASSECIYCFDCVAECPVNAITFKFDKPQSLDKLIPDLANFVKGKKSKSPETSSGFTRRNFLEGTALGATAAVMSKVDYRIKERHPNLIRPPAALPEEEFNIACIRCGECKKACITGGIQPTFLEGGVPSLMTPRLIPSMGYCEEKCNMCSSVCPTGAIQKFKIEEKPHIVIGKAKIDRSSCIAWALEEYCLVCDEHCPYQAIYWKKIDNQRKPFVDLDKCVGCGTCENKCPVQPVAAIRIFNQGELRVELKPGQTWAQVNPLKENPISDQYIERPAPPLTPQEGGGEYREGSGDPYGSGSEKESGSPPGDNDSGYP